MAWGDPGQAPLEREGAAARLLHPFQEACVDLGSLLVKGGRGGHREAILIHKVAGFLWRKSISCHSRQVGKA